jgi:hypothetical protein
MLFDVLFIWGTVFSILAGLIAGFISYKEMVHHYVQKREPLQQAFQTGGLTFLFFMAITLALAFGLPSLFS